MKSVLAISIECMNAKRLIYLQMANNKKTIQSREYI